MGIHRATEGVTTGLDMLGKYKSLRIRFFINYVPGRLFVFLFYSRVIVLMEGPKIGVGIQRKKERTNPPRPVGLPQACAYRGTMAVYRDYRRLASSLSRLQTPRWKTWLPFTHVWPRSHKCDDKVPHRWTNSNMKTQARIRTHTHTHTHPHTH